MMIDEIIAKHYSEKGLTAAVLKNWLTGKKSIQPEIADQAIIEIFIELHEISLISNKKVYSDGNDLGNAILLRAREIKENIDAVLIKTLDDRIKKYLETTAVPPPAVQVKTGYWGNVFNAILGRQIYDG